MDVQLKTEKTGEESENPSQEVLLEPSALAKKRQQEERNKDQRERGQLNKSELKAIFVLKLALLLVALNISAAVVTQFIGRALENSDIRPVDVRLSTFVGTQIREPQVTDWDMLWMNGELESQLLVDIKDLRETFQFGSVANNSEQYIFTVLDVVSHETFLYSVHRDTGEVRLIRELNSENAGIVAIDEQYALYRNILEDGKHQLFLLDLDSFESTLVELPDNFQLQYINQINDAEYLLEGFTYPNEVENVERVFHLDVTSAEVREYFPEVAFLTDRVRLIGILPDDDRYKVFLSSARAENFEDTANEDVYMINFVTSEEALLGTVSHVLNLRLVLADNQYAVEVNVTDGNPVYFNLETGEEFIPQSVEHELPDLPSDFLDSIWSQP